MRGKFSECWNDDDGWFDENHICFASTNYQINLSSSENGMFYFYSNRLESLLFFLSLSVICLYMMRLNIYLIFPKIDPISNGRERKRERESFGTEQVQLYVLV